MTSDEILEHFRRTNALLDGHFVLSSGRHSSSYLQCALALQKPADAIRFGEEIAHLVRTACVSGRSDLVESETHTPTNTPPAYAGGSDFDTVASPAIGGLVIGLTVAQASGKRFIWTERQNGEMTMRRGFTLMPGEKIVVVEDVITTGGSTRECIAALTAAGGDVIYAASITDRSAGAADVGVPRISLASVDMPSYSADECPLCAAGTPAVKPGSRTMPS